MEKPRAKSFKSPVGRAAFTLARLHSEKINEERRQEKERHKSD
jgi:hypothetical protein